MIDQPGEWTLEQVGNGLAYIVSSGNRIHEASFNNTTASKIVAIHNAALNSEEKRANDSIEENVRLLNRLAAEGNRHQAIVDGMDGVIGETNTEIQQLRKQLAAERDCSRRFEAQVDECQKQLAAEREKVTIAAQMVQIESKRANEAEQEVKGK